MGKSESVKTMLLGLIFLVSCADVTPAGKRIHIVETEGTLGDAQVIADKMIAKKDCEFVAYLDAKTSVFPGSYSVHENEIHAALRNRAAKVGANTIIANFYQKPAQGVGLLCPDSLFENQ